MTVEVSMVDKEIDYDGCISRIKLENARDYAREHFVYGIKYKSEYTELKPKTYDETTRYMRDWFQECLHMRTVKLSKLRRKIKYLTLDCRKYSDNPLYKMWKSCTFTHYEIAFFFFSLDYLSQKTEPSSLSDIYNEFIQTLKINGYTFSSAQKWMKKKGCPSGIFVKDANKKYSLAPSISIEDKIDLLSYFSEITPGGVIGSFILDKQNKQDNPFSFKQHYIGQAFDSEVICNVLNAIKNQAVIELLYLPKGMDLVSEDVVPLKVYSSTQNGRQYLLAWHIETDSLYIYRLDRIKDIVFLDSGDVDRQAIQEYFSNVQKHIWGVSLGDGSISHVEFVVKADKDEGFIIRRLIREKRCGTVTVLDENKGLYKFETDVFNPHEMFPWIRSFIGRIVEYDLGDQKLNDMFRENLESMYDMYDIED